MVEDTGDAQSVLLCLALAMVGNVERRKPSQSRSVLMAECQDSASRGPLSLLK